MMIDISRILCYIDNNTLTLEGAEISGRIKDFFMQTQNPRHSFRLERSLWLTKKEWLITLLVGLGCLLILRFHPPCLILHFFHIPCPACGMTRAWLAALRLDLPAAFGWHPMFWSVPILYYYVLRQCRVFKDPVINWLILGLILSGFLVNYIFTLVEFFHPI